jgi:small GTP-binding protein
MSIKTDTRAKFVIIGDANVGKTTITELFTRNKLNDNPISTIGGSFSVKKINVSNNDNIIVNLWDTAGQEKFRSMISTYYRGANVILIVFDISSIKSWESVMFWHNQIYSYIPENDPFPICVLIANKSDKIHNVSIEEIQAKAKELKMNYYILSSFDDDAVEKINDIFKQTSVKLLEILISYNTKKMHDIYLNHMKSNTVILNTPSSEEYLSKLKKYWCNI